MAADPHTAAEIAQALLATPDATLTGYEQQLMHALSAVLAELSEADACRVHAQHETASERCRVAELAARIRDLESRVTLDAGDVAMCVDSLKYNSGYHARIAAMYEGGVGISCAEKADELLALARKLEAAQAGARKDGGDE